MALQNLCLDAIVENFERYFSTYWNSDDVNRKRKFEFLQRIYSQEIATKMFEEYEIEEKHADFVINKYLKSLDTKWFANCSWKAVVAKMAEIGPEIKKISFRKCSKMRPWSKILCYLPNLEVLRCYICVDDVLTNIAEYCPNIIEIIIGSSANVTEKGLKSLCKVRNGNISCSKLKKLIIRYPMPEDASIYLIKNLPSLECIPHACIHHDLYILHHKDLPTIHNVAPYKFTELDFSYEMDFSFYDDMLKLCFSLCPNLRSLVFPVTKPQQLNLISELSNIEKLAIDGSKTGDFLDVDDILKLKGSKLTSLKLCKCMVSLTTLANNCPSVNRLKLSCVDVNCDESSILPFEHLEALTIELAAARDPYHQNLKLACTILSASPKLKYMSLINYDLTQSELKSAILKCCEQNFIQKINFFRSLVGKQFTHDILLACRKKPAFSMEDCDMDSGGEEEIRNNAHSLPNDPKVILDYEISFSDSDDNFSDYSDTDSSESDYDWNGGFYA